MARDASFPVLDLARFEAGSPGEKRAFGAEVDAICRTTGFLAVASHGVPDATIKAAWRKAEAFFALPPERKRSARAPFAGYPYGYLAPETESLARSRGVAAPPDMKESFNGGPARPPQGLADPEALGFCFAPTIWPDAPDGFREAWSAYYAAMEDLAARIMRAFAVALNLPEDFSRRGTSACAWRWRSLPKLASRRARRRSKSEWRPIPL
jgi:isopenicillin N synthase-like dioxygenase